MSLAIALSHYFYPPVDWTLAAIALVAAIAAHVSVNTFNEYFDYRSGLDIQAERTPFSGGSGTLVEHPQLLLASLVLAVVSLSIVVAVGLGFVYLRGWLLLPIGVAGVFLVVFYTTHITRSPLMCSLASGLGFGPLMIGGSVIAISGSSLPSIWLATIPVWLMVNNLLLVSQIPDVAADRAVGRRTLPMVYGLRATVWVYVLSATLAGLLIAMSVLTDSAPVPVLAGLIPCIAALFVASGIRRNASVSGQVSIPELIPYMALNVASAITTPLLMAAGYWLGA